MPYAPPAYLAAPPAAWMPSPYSLLALIGYDETPTTSDHWVNGLIWDSWCSAPASATLSGIEHLCPDPSTIEPNGNGWPTSEASAFSLYALEDCSPVGRSLAEAQERARERLSRHEAEVLEQAIAEGLYGADPYLLQIPVSEAAGSLVEAIGIVEENILRLTGGLGVIHLRHRDALAAMGQQVLTVDPLSGILSTALGSRVVAGVGYGALAGRVVGTSALVARRSPLHEITEAGDALFDHEVNTRYVAAERSYLVGWDCGYAASFSQA